jgi:hypothetical protein
MNIPGLSAFYHDSAISFRENIDDVPGLKAFKKYTDMLNKKYDEQAFRYFIKANMRAVTINSRGQYATTLVRVIV